MRVMLTIFATRPERSPTTGLCRYRDIGHTFLKMPDTAAFSNIFKREPERFGGRRCSLSDSESADLATRCRIGSHPSPANQSPTAVPRSRNVHANLFQRVVPGRNRLFVVRHGTQEQQHRCRSEQALRASPGGNGRNDLSPGEIRCGIPGFDGRRDLAEQGHYADRKGNPKRSRRHAPSLKLNSPASAIPCFGNTSGVCGIAASQVDRLGADGPGAVPGRKQPVSGTLGSPVQAQQFQQFLGQH
jgi:hypothetical protein